MKGELGFLLPMTSSCVSSERGGFGSPTRASSLEKSPNSPSSCVSDGREDDDGFSSSIWESQLEALLDSPSSRVPSGRGSGGFRSPAWESPMETLLNPPSTCAPNGFDGGTGGYSSLLGISGEKGCEAERLLRAIVERYDDCFNRLRDATAELADLRRERLRLSAENLHLSLLLEDLEYEQRKQASAAALTLPPKRAEEDASRGGAPKSISIRSKDFLSQKQPQGEGDPQRLRVRASPAMEEAGEKGDGELEVEAYRQGAAKTELCNKWERGLPCPYGGRCRFAHGPQELRPVIRHPRYKTLACQMFAAASGCPYGHRCHFRHSQSPPPLPVAETH